MKLLFDQNLPPRLVRTLADVYPNSEHVFNLNLDQSSDREIREFALEHGFTIVTKDSAISRIWTHCLDFHQKSSGYVEAIAPRRRSSGF